MVGPRIDGQRWRAVFRRAGSVTKGETTRELTPSAVEFRAWLTDAHDGRILRMIACELAGGIPARTDAYVVARLVQAVHSGRMRFFKRSLPLPLLDEMTPVKTAERDPVVAYTSKDDLDHWIEIRFIDESDCGIPAQRCVIETPDGQLYSHYTDALGYIRIDRIVAGQCKISFPDLDASAWMPVAADP